MSKYVKMAEKQEIPKNKMKVFKVEDIEILVVNVEGELYAFENRCPHMGYPLYFGRLEGKVLTCGFHYAKFDVTLPMFPILDSQKIVSQMTNTSNDNTYYGKE